LNWTIWPHCGIFYLSSNPKINKRHGFMAGHRKQQTPDQTGHRKRLRDRYFSAGIEAFAPHEVVELLLTLAVPRRSSAMPTPSPSPTTTQAAIRLHPMRTNFSQNNSSWQPQQ